MEDLLIRSSDGRNQASLVVESGSFNRKGWNLFVAPSTQHLEVSCWIMGVTTLFDHLSSSDSWSQAISDAHLCYPPTHGWGTPRFGF